MLKNKENFSIFFIICTWEKKLFHNLVRDNSFSFFPQQNIRKHGKFYGTPKYLSVLVHQIVKLIIKLVVFLKKNE